MNEPTKIRAYLESVGATGVHVAHGGVYKNHPRLVWLWRGEEKRFVLPNSPSDWRWEENSIRDLRQMLGNPPPVSEPTREKRSLQEMTDEVIAKAAEAFTVRDMVGDIRMAPEPKPSPVKETKVYPCKMGCYGRIIELAVPADIVRWSKGAAVKITHTADLANIELRVSEGGRCRFDQNNNRLRFSYALEGPVARFGMSPAEAIIVDGVVLISCRVDTRAVVNQSLSAAGRLGGANKTTYKAPLPPASPAEIRRREAPAAEPLESIEGRMIALLRELREIEALGTHRLKPIGFDFPKAPSRWEFRPVGRTIKLED